MTTWRSQQTHIGVDDMRSEVFISTLVLPLLKDKARSVMLETSPSASKLCWCQVPVPKELEAERVCVLHFILTTEHDCADLRRETAMGRSTAVRQTEIANYVKATALKLTEVATGRMRLSDELKKRILTTLLILMNLQESIDRSANRAGAAVRELRSAMVVPG